ncbi:MAG UNVERIFIED_CONTAM: hypothetical protein LVQ98_08290 [Rickettsiaceae bacterium]
MLLFLVVVAVAWIGFLLYNVDPNLQKKRVDALYNKKSCTSWLKGFILIGVVAMCMSKADANLNSATVILTHDLFTPLGLKIKNELFLSKIIAITLGCGAIYLASLDYSILALTFLVQSFHSPIAAIPLIFAILGFRTTTRVVLLGMASGFITVIYWRCFMMEITGLDSNIPGSLGNLIVLFGAHYLLREPGAWVGGKDNTYLIQARNERRYKMNKFVHFIRDFSFVQFCKSNAPKNELAYTGFGIFSLISTICTMYSSSNSSIIDSNILLFFYETMLILSVSFITYPIWPAVLKKDTPVQIIWNFSVFYILIVCSTFFVMLSNFNQIQLMISLVNLIVVATLMRWQAAIILIIIGALATIEFYENMIGIKITHSAMLSAEIKVVYLLLLLSSILIIFFKPRQEAHDLLGTKNEYLGEQIKNQKEELDNLINLKNEFLRNLTHELHTPVTGITSMAGALWKNYDQLSKLEQKDNLEIIAKSTERFNSYIDSILNLSKLSSASFKLNVLPVNLSELLLDRMEACMSMYSDGKNLEFITEIEPDIIHNLISTICSLYLII